MQRPLLPKVRIFRATHSKIREGAHLWCRVFSQDLYLPLRKTPEGIFKRQRATVAQAVAQDDLVTEKLP